jgi:hypothetical protein
MFLFLKFSKVVAMLLFAGLFYLPNSVAANPVGQIADVVQNATVERSGQRRYLQRGESIALGDIITTGATGQVQITFQDQTRIAMSANSRLVIEDILFDSSSTASQFTVGAVEGAFRFLSGNSEKSAYSVRTPNGTMGIRGTEFDFSVVPQSSVSVVTFRGEVLLCNRSNRCAIIRGGCAAVQLSSSGQFGVPETRAEKSALLSRGFPYIKDQDGLSRDFRTRVWTCGSQATRNFDGDMPSLNAPEQPQTPGTPGTPGTPDTPDAPGRNPDTGGAQAGNGTSAGLGGSTADGVDAGRGGPSAPGNANAGDGGASAGAPGGPSGASAGGGAASAGSTE